VLETRSGPGSSQVTPTASKPAACSSVKHKAVSVGSFPSLQYLHPSVSRHNAASSFNLVQRGSAEGLNDGFCEGLTLGASEGGILGIREGFDEGV